MKKIFKSKRTKVTVLSLAAIFLLSTGLVTLSLLYDDTQELTNTFELGEVTTEIVEEFQRITNTTFQKEPNVKNTGENDCYVRVRVTISPADAVIIPADSFNIGEGEGLWTKGADGYYYYNSVLKVNETTLNPVFELVEVVDTSIDGFEVTVYQEAVQAKMNAADGTSTTDMMTIWAAYEANKIPDSFKTTAEQ